MNVYDILYSIRYVKYWQQMVLAFCSSRCAASLCAKQASPTSKLSDSNDNLPITDHLWPTTKAPEYQIFRQVSGQQHHLPRWRDRRCSILARPDGPKASQSPNFNKHQYHDVHRYQSMTCSALHPTLSIGWQGLLMFLTSCDSLAWCIFATWCTQARRDCNFKVDGLRPHILIYLSSISISISISIIIIIIIIIINPLLCNSWRFFSMFSWKKILLIPQNRGEFGAPRCERSGDHDEAVAPPVRTRNRPTVRACCQMSLACHASNTTWKIHGLQLDHYQVHQATLPRTKYLIPDLFPSRWPLHYTWWSSHWGPETSLVELRDTLKRGENVASWLPEKSEKLHSK